MKKWITVPIFSVRVLLVIHNNAHDIRQSMEHEFGPHEGEYDWTAMCSSHGSTFGLFFFPDPSIAIVAHEVFHLTHRILDWTEVEFSINSQEAGALRHAFLMEEILTKCLKKN